jgi:hypothetical protein
MADAIGVHLDVTGMMSQVKGMDKKFATAMKKELRTAINTSGSDLLSAVKSAGSWSSKIPGATTVSLRSTSKASSVKIQVNNKQAPAARARELGNKTTFDKSVINAHGGFKTSKSGERVAANHGIYKAMKSTGVGTGRALAHPVFGHGDRSKWHWSQQPVHPFFFNTIEQNLPATQPRMEEAMTQIARAAGFN